MSTETTDAKGIITVDYTKSLEEMIAAGRYDWVNRDITPSRFPIVGTGVAEFETKVFHFDRYISSEDAVTAIKADDTQNPWEQPAKIEALLAYGAKNPDEQRQYPIIGLGSVARVRSGRRVPGLGLIDAERDLGLGWWGSDWRAHHRFLAVRKVRKPELGA
jgi:hypothetical protein